MFENKFHFWTNEFVIITCIIIISSKRKEALFHLNYQKNLQLNLFLFNMFLGPILKGV